MKNLRASAGRWETHLSKSAKGRAPCDCRAMLQLGTFTRTSSRQRLMRFFCTLLSTRKRRQSDSADSARQYQDQRRRTGVSAPHGQRKRPRSFLNVAFIYAGNYLLCHTCVARAPSPAKRLTLRNRSWGIPGIRNRHILIVPLVTYSFGCFWQAHESQWREIKSKSKAAGGGARSSHSLFTIDIPMTQALLKGKYEYRRRLPRYQKDDRAVFVTFCCGCLDPLPETARDIVLRHCLHDQGTKAAIHAVVVMPDHVHLLLTPLRDLGRNLYSLVEILQGIKSTSAHSLNRELGRSGPVWQEESFDHVLRSEESFEEKVEYIRQNPVRAGLVRKAEDYRWLWVG